MLPFVLLCFLFASCSGSKKTTTVKPTIKKEGVTFRKSSTLSDLLDEAKKSNKVVFVDLYTTWCLPCKLMDEDVFTDKGIGDFMNDNFINYKVDAEKANGPGLVLVYDVKAYPTLLFVDPSGKVLVKKEGAAYHTELMEMGQRALELNGAMN